MFDYIFGAVLACIWCWSFYQIVRSMIRNIQFDIENEKWLKEHEEDEDDDNV